MADNIYQVEYASTARAKCKDTKCKGQIAKDELRIVKLSKNPFGEEDDLMKSFYHPGCFFSAMQRARTAKPVHSKDDIENFDDIKQEDQELVEELIKNQGSAGKADKKAGKKAAAKPKAKAAATGTKRKAATPANESGDESRWSSYLVCEGKFWSCTIEAGSSTMSVRYGKVGSPGAKKDKELASYAAAVKEAEKVKRQKEKKGYEADEEEKEDGGAAGGDDEEEQPAKKKKKPAAKSKGKKKGKSADEDEEAEEEDEEADE